MKLINNNSLSKYLDKIDTFIFDLDGTFYPIFFMYINLLALMIRHPIAGYNFYKARKKFRKTCWPEQSFTSRELFLKRQAECINKTKEYFNKYIYRYINIRLTKLRAYKRVLTTLEYLKEKGKKLYVYSDFPIGNKLEELKISNIFDGEFSSEDAGFLKPDKRGLIYLKSKFSFDVERTLYIGDRILTDGDFAVNCSMSFAQIGREWKW